MDMCDVIFENLTFIKARNELIEIYNDELQRFCETEKMIQEIDKNILKQSENRLQEIRTRQVGFIEIIKILERNFIKVVFFGKTSNGKSSVINAMLRNKVMPTGVGHTTTCFIQLQGCKNGSSYLTLGNSNEKVEIDLLKKIANNLSKDKLEKPEVLNIYWPKSECVLLNNDVIIIDTPGIDMDDNFDGLIEKYCTDADIFVLVENAVTVLSKSEKEFLINVSNRLSNPNPFVLYNQWDKCEEDCGKEELNLLREEHCKQATDFLTKFCPKDIVEKRIYFTSAKETLKIRLKEEGSIVRNYKGNHQEFENFERELEKCISVDVIQTKFIKHFENAKSNIRFLQETQNYIKDILNISVEDKEKNIERFKKELNELKDNIEETKKNCEVEIEQIKENVELKLTDNFQTIDIRTVVNSFSREFDSRNVGKYKEDLNDHVLTEVNKTLKENENYVLLQVEKCKENISIKISTLIKSHRERTNSNCLRIDSINMSSDFKENIDFRFSTPLLNILDKTKTVQIGVTALSVFSYKLPIYAIFIPVILHGGLWMVKQALNTNSELEKRLKEQYMEYTKPKIEKKIVQIKIILNRHVSTVLKNYLHEQMRRVENYETQINNCINECERKINMFKEFQSNLIDCNNKSLETEEKLNGFNKNYLRR